MDNNTEDLTAAYMLGKQDGRKETPAVVSELSLYSEIRDLAERFEERAKALEATLEDECDGSKETRYRWKIKAGMFRSIGMEVKQRLQSWEIHQNGKDGHA